MKIRNIFFRQSGTRAAHLIIQHGIFGITLQLRQRSGWPHTRLNGKSFYLFNIFINISTILNAYYVVYYTPQQVYFSRYKFFVPECHRTFFVDGLLASTPLPFILLPLVFFRLLSFYRRWPSHCFSDMSGIISAWIARSVYNY